MVHKSIRVSAILSVLLLGVTSAVGADQAPAMPSSGSSNFSTTPIPTDTIATVYHHPHCRVRSNIAVTCQ
jgi:hypothetical protein